MEMDYIDVIMQFEMRFTAGHGGGFLNGSPSFGGRHWTLA